MITSKTELVCPSCGSNRVTLTAEQMFMANTLEHYCHSVKIQDDEAKASCLNCGWGGRRRCLEEKLTQTLKR